MDYFEEAVKKLELSEKEQKSLGQKEKVVMTAVKEMLTEFCKQEPEFAQAIAQSKAGFAECLKETVKGAGSAISDIDVYRKACAFYFPTATVDMVLTIDLAGNRNITASNGSDSSAPQSPLKMNFADFFGD